MYVLALLYHRVVDTSCVSVSDNCQMRLLHGMMLNPLTLTWRWTQDTSVNYALHAVKNQDFREEEAMSV